MDLLIKQLRELYSFNSHNELISDSQDHFGDYGEKLLNLITKDIPRNSYSNDTDWNYSTCFSFIFVLEEKIPYPHISQKGLVDLLKSIKHPFYTVHFDISAILKFYRYIFVSSELIDNNSLIKHIRTLEPPHQDVNIINLIEQNLVRNGFSKIDEAILPIKIPKIKLGDIKKGKASIYNFLFHHYYEFPHSGDENIFFEKLHNL